MSRVHNGERYVSDEVRRRCWTQPGNSATG
ncbi:hypothetical protein [Streptomyces swartbergensis]